MTQSNLTRRTKRVHPFTLFLQLGKPGDVFYYDRPDKDAAARASQQGRKIQTERMIALPTNIPGFSRAKINNVETFGLRGTFITKVTIVK